MKDFLVYLHTQLSKILLLHKSTEPLTKEDSELFTYIRGTVSFLENYTETITDPKLFQIIEDMQYSIGHMRVPFKAEAALNDVEKNISEYNH
jgi:hypothetical protein